jgi:two-component system LytT family response regulator
MTVAPGMTRSVRVVVVDDEPLAVDSIRIALAAEPGVEVVGSCETGAAAVRAIQELRPDLVFLDVQMPGMDGFEVIEAVGPGAMPEVVFVTAFQAHALRAFEVHAVDYLLKPYDDGRFAECLRHALERVRSRRAGELEGVLEGVLDSLRGASGDGADSARGLARILVRERDRVRFVDADGVDWFEAAGNYVRVHVGGTTHLVRTTVAELAARLDPQRFVRIHRSTIVNVARIREVQPWAGGDWIAILEDGERLKVSRTYRDELLRPLA